MSIAWRVSLRIVTPGWRPVAERKRPRSSSGVELPARMPTESDRQYAARVSRFVRGRERKPGESADAYAYRMKARDDALARKRAQRDRQTGDRPRSGRPGRPPAQASLSRQSRNDNPTESYKNNSLLS